MLIWIYANQFIYPTPIYTPNANIWKAYHENIAYHHQPSFGVSAVFGLEAPSYENQSPSNDRIYCIFGPWAQNERYVEGPRYWHLLLSQSSTRESSNYSNAWRCSNYSNASNASNDDWCWMCFFHTDRFLNFPTLIELYS